MSPQEAAHRLRCYMREAEPLAAEMAKIHGLFYKPAFVMMLHSDGSSMLCPMEPEYPPVVQQALDGLREQMASLRRAYGLE